MQKGAEDARGHRQSWQGRWLNRNNLGDGQTLRLGTGWIRECGHAAAGQLGGKLLLHAHLASTLPP